jgi:hypothetical protein
MFDVIFYFLNFRCLIFLFSGPTLAPATSTLIGSATITIQLALSVSSTTTSAFQSSLQSSIVAAMRVEPYQIVLKNIRAVVGAAAATNSWIDVQIFTPAGMTSNATAVTRVQNMMMLLQSQVEYFVGLKVICISIFCGLHMLIF